MNQASPRLIVTCDEPPCPPFNGNNRKSFEVIEALRGDFDIHVLTYPVDDSDWKKLQEHWRSRGVTCHRLYRRMAKRYQRLLTSGLSLPTVTRDFSSEARLVKLLHQEVPKSQLLIDFISGAPLLREFNGCGTVLSGHDCMSYLFEQEGRFASCLRDKLYLRLRRRFALNAEKRFAHLSARTHVVSSQDAAELRRINPRARTTVIPIGGDEADTASLRPMNQRHLRIIWGSLGSGLILSGLRRIFNIAQREDTTALQGWTLIGRVPEAETRTLLPELDSLGVTYLAQVDDIDMLLSDTIALLLPDIGGTGQKNRALDGLRHGCCVFGMAEVFRGIESPGSRAFVSCNDYETLVRSVSNIDQWPCEDIGKRAMQLFVSNFSRPVLAAQWRALLSSIGWLEPTNPTSSHLCAFH